MKIITRLLAVALLASAHAFADSNPIESELFPPDFLFAQRDALGLSETQLQDFQAIVQEAQSKFENLKGPLEERSKALQDALHQPKPDIAQTEEKLRDMLTVENQMKLFQIHVMLTLRNKLTPEQVEKARQLRPQLGRSAGNATEGLADRLKMKFEKLRGLVEARAAGGQPPEDVVAKAHEIQNLVQSGKPLEAEQQIDALLKSLSDEKPKP